MSIIRSSKSKVKLVQQNIYESSTTKKQLLGDCLEIGGREFIYCYSAAGVAVARMAQGALQVVTHTSMACPTISAIGERHLHVTLGVVAISKDEYADGWATIDAGTGLGQIRRIKSHPAADALAALEIELYDELVTATEVGVSTISLCKNKADSVVVVPLAAQTAPAIGVPLVAIGAGEYGWFQYKGEAPVLTQGAVIVGQKVGWGGTANGACGAVPGDLTEIWGIVRVVGATGTISTIDLKL